MKRSALPLPRYVLRKPLKEAWGYFFNVPMWARQAGCPVSNEALGTDYAAAVQRAETVLLPAFDDWRTGGIDDAPTAGVRAGTLDWLFAEYRADRRFTKLDPGTRRKACVLPTRRAACHSRAAAGRCDTAGRRRRSAIVTMRMTWRK